MATYAIGDVQGCYAELQALLEKIAFNPTNDTLWFTGDLVNRGPQSLEVLRFCVQLGERCVNVLGNHDLHLLALAEHGEPVQQDDTLAPILKAPDRDELLAWLRQCPMVHAEQRYAMVHAGFAPQWDLPTAIKLGQEVEAVLRSGDYREFFQHMYGNAPDCWQDDLAGWDRLRCIVNYMTRMRFCAEDGRLDLQSKGKQAEQPDKFLPWFMLSTRKTQHDNVIFGHWAALEGKVTQPQVFALDTGCVWGGALTAFCVEKQSITSVP